MKYKIVLIILIIVLFLIIGLFYWLAAPNRKSTTYSSPINKGVLIPTKRSGKDVEIVAENLQIPWEIAFLPENEILITERSGTLLKLGKDRTVIEVSGVAHVGEGGLLGLALHPNFTSNSFIYLYLTSNQDNGLVNRVERYRLTNNIITDKTVILDNIPGSRFHDGGRIEFGPDGYLYITTGDAGNGKRAQDTNSLNGKILRIADDGSVPSDNPFGNQVYSYGHRNPQGLTWDSNGNLWVTEHGRSGIRSGFDELNLIVKGGNYGWPDFQGDEQEQGMILPILHSGPNTTWAPAGAEFVNNSIFFAGLKGATLYEAILSNNEVSELAEHFSNTYGRIRAVRLGPDGYLYITTSNQDGRGKPKSGDDKLIRINPEIFE